MAEYNGGNRAPLQPNPLDVMSTWVFSEPVNGATKRPNFRVKVMGNVPRITVKTNVPDDKNNGRIDFKTDAATFAVILNTIKRFAKGELEEPIDFEHNDHIFVNGKRSDNALTLATVKVGKDRTNGKIYIAVLGHNRPKIQFFFGPSQYHAMKRGDGSPIDEGEVSAAYAIGFVDSIAPMVNALLVNLFDADARNVAKAPNAQGGQGGGGNYGGGGGGQRRGGGGGGNYGGGNSGGGGGQPQRQGGGDDFGNVDGFDDWA